MIREQLYLFLPAACESRMNTFASRDCASPLAHCGANDWVIWCQLIACTAPEVSCSIRVIAVHIHGTVLWCFKTGAHCTYRKRRGCKPPRASTQSCILQPLQAHSLRLCQANSTYYPHQKIVLPESLLTIHFLSALNCIQRWLSHLMFLLCCWHNIWQIRWFANHHYAWCPYSSELSSQLTLSLISWLHGVHYRLDYITVS